MSRIGKLPITVPEGVKVNFQPAGKSQVEVTVQGPKGELKTCLSEAVDFHVLEKEINVTLNPKFSNMRAMWGTARAVVANMIKGVVEGYQKQLELQGTGYKVNLQGEKLVLDVGYSKSVEFVPPKGIKVEVEKNIITISGIDKQMVGETAARIRKIRKVEPYKGKGLRYVGEIVRRKEGKKAVGESS
jgi:large subunit ribosomal protein L6